MQSLPLMPLAQLDISGLTGFMGNLTYLALLLIALWGAYSVVMVWMRVARQRFRSDEALSLFLDELEGPLERGDFDAAAQICDGDPRAVSQLALVAINNRQLGYAKVKHLVMDRFQRDVLSDLEQRLSWVNTVIKSAPMVGLFGTVIGMMGAFGKLAGAANVSPDVLAQDISVALITTASGLAIAIPLVILVASINIRIRKMEDLVGAGIGRVLDTLRDVTVAR
ncbi:MAG: MotA/TolQ/ExbB proton channel family protein [Planctomycetales bacterium]|nr:MotA/TolQ/ExbB proton channel family protein [Planctomycetales bacterium]MCA9170832.1 MotA/TolQ/ExbB proton channel family protein [Planctomycetales bacterium]